MTCGDSYCHIIESGKAASLLAEESLRRVRRVIVLVDDLDGCLPDTVVETLETIRLFLAVPKMSFVVAADEDRVADALRERYPKGTPGGETSSEPAEEPAFSSAENPAN